MYIISRKEWFYMTVLTACFFMALTDMVRGTNLYVSLNGSSTPPYTNWAMASTNLQHAVNLSAAGDIIYVTNMTYYPTGTITIGKSVAVIGYGDRPAFDGNMTCCPFNLNNSGAVLSGIIITNGTNSGYSYGGGIRLDNGLVTNCIITACGSGAGSYGAGGIYLNNNATVIDSIISNNSALRFGNNYGGGIGNRGGTAGSTQYITRCQIVNNRGIYGGGIYADTGRTVIQNCVIRNNYGAQGAGMVIGSANTTVVQNCLIAGNIMNISAWYGAGLFVGSYYSEIDNCTIVSNVNAFSDRVGGCAFYSAGTTLVANTIIYMNDDPGNVYSNICIWTGNGAVVYFTNCCTAPLTGLQGVNNISNNPAFINKDSGNWHLSQSSPCINAGVNRGWMTIDLDGLSRIDRFSRLVDMGCYEYLPPGMMITVP